MPDYRLQLEAPAHGVRRREVAVWQERLKVCSSAQLRKLLLEGDAIYRILDTILSVPSDVFECMPFDLDDLQGQQERLWQMWSTRSTCVGSCFAAPCSMRKMRQTFPSSVACFARC